MLTRDLAQAFQKTRFRRHQPHIPCGRLDNDTGNLPPVFPDPIRACIDASRRIDSARPERIRSCAEALRALVDNETQCSAPETLERIAAGAASVSRSLDHAAAIHEEAPGCFAGLKTVIEHRGLDDSIEIVAELHALRKDLIEILSRTRIQTPRLARLKQLSDRLDASEGSAGLRGRMQELRQCEEIYRRLLTLLAELAQNAALVRECASTVETLAAAARARAPLLDELSSSLAALAAEKGVSGERRRDTRSVVECLTRNLRATQLIPITEQLTGDSGAILAKLAYNSVVTFVVGEKAMIQMPTWFFPSGAGPFTDDGHVATHGFPNPEATFRFAEPVFIDSKQNFRVELEVPDFAALHDLQRVYGPLFIWVVLDGYRTRDVQ